MSRKSLVALVFVLGAVAWALVLTSLTGPPSGVLAQGAQSRSGGLGTGGWVVIAAIAGAVFTSLGAFLNDYYAGRREDRLAQRVATEQRQQWAREDQRRKEDEAEADRLRVREQRATSYKAFVAATSFPAPFEVDQQAGFTQELNERYTEVVLYCSATLEGDAAGLYEQALKALAEPEADEDAASRQELRKVRTEFWFSVRVEAQEDYSHS